MGERIRPVVIVGMHRSGTSLVGAIISELGYDLGNSADSDLYNITGYFEDLSLIHLNEKLLEKLGGSWKSPPEEKVISKHCDEIRKAYKEIIANRKSPWGVKDPRLSLFLEPFLQAIEPPLVVFCRRNARHVARSLAERDLISEQDAISLKRRYDESVKKSLGSTPYFVVDYDVLIENPSKTIAELCGFLGVELKPSAVNLVMSPQEVKKKKGGYLLRTVLYDIGKLIRNPSILMSPRPYRRLRRYFTSAVRLLNLGNK